MNFATDLEPLPRRRPSRSGSIVTERGRPVARIVATSGESWLDELVAAGVVTLPERDLDLSSFGRVNTKGDVMEFVFDQRR